MAKNTDVNYWGAIHGCRAFIPTMKAQGRGHIVNVSACAGIFSLGAMGPYNVAKAGMIALSETLHKELYENGIRVSVVPPHSREDQYLREQKQRCNRIARRR